MGNHHDETEPMERIHVRLYTEDLEEIRAKFGRGIGINKAIRQMVHKYLVYLREHTREVVGKQSQVDIKEL